MANVKKTEYHEGDTHPAILGYHTIVGRGHAAGIQTTNGVRPCFVGDFIVEDENGVHIESANGETK